MMKKMKPVYGIFLCLGLLFLVLTSSIKGETEISRQTIRIGLKQSFEDIPTVHIGNKSVLVGFNQEGQWTKAFGISSQTGFDITPAKGYFLISNENFLSYEESYAKVDLLKQQGFSAYVGVAAQGIYKVYVGNTDTKDKATTIQAQIESVNGLTYTLATDNSQRTIISGDVMYPIVFENTGTLPLLATDELVGDVPVMLLSKGAGVSKYRGTLEIGRYGSALLTVINVVEIDAYLYAVVPSEMTASWPIEALKAQAVAARNYAVYYISSARKYPKEAYDLCDTTASQVYKGFSAEAVGSTQAVNETRNKLIYYNGKVILANFFASSGGRTESSENVWSAADPFQRSVSDIYETEPSRNPWLLELSSAQIQKALEAKGVAIGAVQDVTVDGVTESGRAMNLKVVGATSTYNLSKETMRLWLGLNSRKFTLIKKDFTPQKIFAVLKGNLEQTTVAFEGAYAVTGTSQSTPVLLNSKLDQVIVTGSNNIKNYPLISGKSDTYIFAGEGIGHGVGLSQTGAKGMAKAGFKYNQILEHYFTGTKVN